VNNRLPQLYNAPLNELLTILLRQFRRLLELKDAALPALSQQMPTRQPLNASSQTLRQRLIEVVEESESVLAQWNLSFDQSLNTTMDEMPGWESTADFLDIANEKSNAELRIAAASLLVTALGDLRFVPHLLAAIAHDPDEIETVAARRILSQFSGVDFAAQDWSEQIDHWYEGQSRGDA
jgi:hypothetical protein